jgi:hypothetical protein
MPDADTTQTDSTATDTQSGTDATKPVTTVEDLQAALAELGLTPGQVKARLEAGKKQEARAKENATKASEYDKLAAELEKTRQENMSASEKELQKLRTEAHATGVAEATATYGSQLVKAEFKGLLAGRGIDADRVTVLADNLATAAYLSADGTIDSAALSTYIEALAPQQSTQASTGLGSASFGAGQRPATSTASGAAGLAEAQRRFGKKTT